MTDPTFTISIGIPDDDTLELSGTETTALTIVGYQEPARQARIGYAPTSVWIHGEQALSWSWQQSMLQFDVSAKSATTEGVARAAIAELVSALAQFSYPVTVTVADSDPEVWTCDPGTVAPSGARSFEDLKYHDPVWSVSIPCYPVPTIEAGP